MANPEHYEEQILKELRALPEEAVPKILRLITLVRQEFLTEEPLVLLLISNARNSR
jgi:hypothetical protein